MEIVIFLNLIIGLVVAGKLFINPKQSQPQLTAPETQMALSPSHTLVRVWDNRSCEHDRQGWWFECSCGMKRSADGTNSKSYGSESKAITSYQVHAKLHTDISPEKNEWKEKYEAVESEFAKYREACYCKNLNDDILILKGNP
jgi:hypothetical protein